MYSILIKTSRSVRSTVSSDQIWRPTCFDKLTLHDSSENKSFLLKSVIL